MGTYISPAARVHPTAYVGEGVQLYGHVSIGAHCVIEDFVVVGKPDMYALAEWTRHEGPSDIAAYDAGSTRPTTIGSRSVVGTGGHIYCGSHLADDVEVEDYIRIGWDSVIGTGTRVMYGAQVYCNVSVGRDCRIAGFVADNTVIEDRVSFFGSTVHDYFERTTGYEYRPSPRICDDATVAFGAHVIGGVTVGSNAYVGAAAIVTRDVPPDVVVTGANQHCPRKDWIGKLAQSGRGE